MGSFEPSGLVSQPSPGLVFLTRVFRLMKAGPDYAPTAENPLGRRDRYRKTTIQD
jgi:hypothetical protein